MTISDPGNGGWLARIFGLKPRKKSQRNLPALIRYDDDVSLGRSPTIREIEALARKAGFRSLLNLNTEGESGQILSPNVEATWAHTFEMQHERVSVDPLYPRGACVDRFLETLRQIAKPVYVHSLQGHRAAAFLTIRLGLEWRCPGTEAMTEAKHLGMDCHLHQLQRFVESEVDRRRAASGPEPTPRRCA